MATLSQVRAWDTTHLHTAANHWNAVAQAWEQSFDAVHQESFAPGGSEWTGEGAEAAQHQTAVDRKHALRSVDTLLTTATIARSGASVIESAKSNVLTAVANAENNGFVVGEDFSVTDPKRYPPPVAAARHVQAARHSVDITGRVQTLAATDKRVAGQMSQGVFAADFPLDGPKPLDPVPPVPPQPQPAPTSPAPQPSPAPPVTGEPIKLPPRTGPPPVTVIDANLPAPPPNQPVDLFPNCSGSRVFWDFTKIFVGGLGIAGGAVADPFTFGAGTVPIIAGAASLAEGEYDLSQCK
ncbi:MAG TPA: hypothetical protein VH496_07210 [Mycobacterium sp.]|jgi:hypothetical protein